jgi:CMP-N,N'-diacetyllegionaminic acid synthase
MKYLAIIPARIGSKRVPLKNLKILNGKPLIEWSIEAAKGSKYITEIFVSSDSQEILEIGARHGAVSNGLRPKILAEDKTSSFDVVLHVLDSYASKSIPIENIVLLQPTSPLRTSADIDNAIDIYESNNQLSLQSYSQAECPPQWVYKIIDNKFPDRISNEKNIRSQDLGNYYRINGAIYIMKPEILLATKTFTPKDSIAYIMPRERSIDIDDPLDFFLAEKLMEY